MRGGKSHEIVLQGLDILKRLEHRGACGADPLTGDGAGLLIQLPDTFLREECAKIRIDLPEFGRYASGLVFLPRKKNTKNCAKILEKVIKKEGLKLLGWREVPVDNSSIGIVARGAEPVIRQIFVGASDDVVDVPDFERRLYCIRKLAANAVREAGYNPDNESFYICSLSSKNLHL